MALSPDPASPTPASPDPAPSPLPEQPDLRHLKDQARDLVRIGAATTLSAARLAVAREYGFASWPRLKAHVESLNEAGRLKAAIDANDIEQVRELMTRSPELHRAPLGYGKNGPLTWVAECRIPWEAPGETRLAMARWMLEHGSDVHQGGDGPLMRAALYDLRIPMLELLLEHGADVNARWGGRYPIICAPCETLQPGALRRLIEHGADPMVRSAEYGTPLSMVIGTYSRDAAGRRACLEVFAELGCTLPDTPVMELARGRLDLLDQRLSREPDLLKRRFRLEEIYPPEVGLDPQDGLHLTPLAGATLLHLAVEYCDLEAAAWLLDHGADPNLRAATDADGFGGHTPLYHTVITLGPRTDALTRLLLHHGADPNLRASLRKQLRHMGDPDKERLHEFHNVTATEFAHQFQEPAWVNHPALALLEG